MTTDVNSTRVFGTYERQVIEEIHAWARQDPGWVDRTLGGASSRSRAIIDMVLGSPKVRPTVERAVDQVATALAERFDTAPAGAAALTGPDELPAREEVLRRLDERASELRTRYIAGMTAQGAVAGAASMTAVGAALVLVPDTATALILALRAAADHLSLYGVRDAGRPAMTAAIALAALASETEPMARRRQIVALAAELEDPSPTTEVPPSRAQRLLVQRATSHAVRETLEQTLRRMLHRRLASFIPLVGMAANTAASAWLGDRVAATGSNLGRVVYLARRSPCSTRDILGVI